MTSWLRGSSASQLDSLATDPAQRAALSELRAETLSHTTETAPDDPLALSDREDELQDWLEHYGVERPWELAPVLVSFGWDKDELERLMEHFSPTQLPGVVGWLGACSLVYGLLVEVEKSAEAMSEIVKAVKTYSYLDQGPIQEVDVRESLENTLVLLRPEINAGFDIKRDFPTTYRASKPTALNSIRSGPI